MDANAFARPLTLPSEASSAVAADFQPHEQRKTRTSVSGTVANPIGITNPPIDDLLKAADSKYALVIYSAKRARQINAYYSQLQEGLLDYVGPLVETEISEKPLSIALREINEGLVTSEAAPEE
jgi:DNA-directed RNA polymerase subunit omega